MLQLIQEINKALALLKDMGLNLSGVSLREILDLLKPYLQK
jgi:hypothetical protein